MDRPRNSEPSRALAICDSQNKGRRGRGKCGNCGLSSFVGFAARAFCSRRSPGRLFGPSRAGPGGQDRWTAGKLQEKGKVLSFSRGLARSALCTGSSSEDGLIYAVNHLHFHLRSARPVFAPPPRSQHRHAGPTNSQNSLRLKRVGVIRASKVAFDEKLSKASKHLQNAHVLPRRKALTSCSPSG